MKRRRPARAAETDVLILSDGTILAHNLTPAMAAVLNELNPQDATFRARAAAGGPRPKGHAQPAPGSL